MKSNIRNEELVRSAMLHAGPYKGKSRDQLVAETKLTSNQVYRVLRKLEDDGEIFSFKSTGPDFPRNTNIYQKVNNTTIDHSIPEVATVIAESVAGDKPVDTVNEPTTEFVARVIVEEPVAIMQEELQQPVDNIAAEPTQSNQPSSIQQAVNSLAVLIATELASMVRANISVELERLFADVGKELNESIFKPKTEGWPQHSHVSASSKQNEFEKFVRTKFINTGPRGTYTEVNGFIPFNGNNYFISSQLKNEFPVNVYGHSFFQTKPGIWVGDKLKKAPRSRKPSINIPPVGMSPIGMLPPEYVPLYSVNNVRDISGAGIHHYVHPNCEACMSANVTHGKTGNNGMNADIMVSAKDKPEQFDNQFSGQEPPTPPAKEVKKIRLPKICITGMLPVQCGRLMEEFSQTFDIYFWNDRNGENCSQLYQFAEECQAVFWHTKHSSHSDESIARSKAKDFFRVGGDLSSMRSALTKYYNDNKNKWAMK